MLLNDHDPVETQEWIDAMRSVVQYQGVERMQFLLGKLREEARLTGAMPPFLATTPYMNGSIGSSLACTVSVSTVPVSTAVARTCPSIAPIRSSRVAPGISASGRSRAKS